MPLVKCSDFVMRQTQGSEFSHYEGHWVELEALVEANWSRQNLGYREGVILVPVEPDQFFTSIVQLKPGDRLEGEYKSRREGEEPRKSIGVAGGKKMPAKSVEIVCYAAHVLDEDGDRSTDAEWEIVSVNASPFEEGVEVPMGVGTLLANHFHLDGGTETNMTPEQLVDALHKSVLFWKDKARIEK